VQRAVLYEARPAVALSAGTARALASGIVDFALFFSPRTAAIFAGLAEHAGVIAALRGVTAVSISAAADSALAGLGFHEHCTADTPDQRGLLAALDRLLLERRRA